MPTVSSVYSTPFVWQLAASSSSIAREASVASQSPASALQNNSKPSPVPGPSIRTEASGLSSANSSATSDEIGSTVEEPVTFTSPLVWAPAAP